LSHIRKTTSGPHVLPRLASMPIGAITTLEVRAWVAELSAAVLAPATVHKPCQTLSEVLRAAVDNDMLALSPSRRMPIPEAAGPWQPGRPDEWWGGRT